MKTVHSLSFMAPLSKKDKHLPVCSSPSIPVLLSYTTCLQLTVSIFLMLFFMPAFHLALGLPLVLFYTSMSSWCGNRMLRLSIFWTVWCLMILLNKQQAHTCVCKICLLLVLFPYLWKHGILTLNCYRILDDVDVYSGSA